MKWALLAVGWLSLALGIVGIFLPLLPTTPFLLLAALCFSKASPRLHRWLLEHRITGPIILDWRTRGVIRLRAKIVATLLLLPTLYLAVGTQRWPWAVHGALFLLVVGVLLFLWTRKSR
jgi:uncharacterized membrane protein YbaN (DUF454 family)